MSSVLSHDFDDSMTEKLMRQWMQHLQRLRQSDKVPSAMLPVNPFCCTATPLILQKFDDMKDVTLSLRIVNFASARENGHEEKEKEREWKGRDASFLIMGANSRFL